MSRVFISYRRDDSADVAGRIYDRLESHYGADSVFKDVDTIPLGVDFRKHLTDAVSRCEVLLAVIGRQWLTVAGPAGSRRLEEPRDFVRIEIEAALQRDIPVIPLLVQGATMPGEEDLPPTLQALAFRNGTEVRRDPDFRRDMDRLLHHLDRLLQQLAQQRDAVPPPPTVPAVAPQPKPVPRPEQPNSLRTTFVRVPRGTFWMGGGSGQPSDRQVEIPHDFYLGVHAVTQGQWQAVMGSNPSHFSRTGGGKDQVKGISDADLKQFPVENVSWDDVQQFLQKLNAREKTSEWLYRLPTEAEWEYGCRGGASSQEECAFDFYLDRPTNDLSSSQANFDGNRPAGKAPKGNYLQRPTKVGSYKPNRLGLYDMHGNVWEWCADSEGSDRVIRGGSWRNHASRCRAASRSLAPSFRNFYLGFRLARVPSGQ